jgi:hypothetical protein
VIVLGTTRSTLGRLEWDSFGILQTRGACDTVIVVVNIRMRGR